MDGVKPLVSAEVGAARLDVCVADITTLALDAVVNARSLAAAASTVPFIAPPGRTCWRNAGRSAAARPVVQRSRADTGCRRRTSFTPSARYGAVAAAAKTIFWRRAIARRSIW
jgi:hypothetical protein